VQFRRLIAVHNFNLKIVVIPNCKQFCIVEPIYASIRIMDIIRIMVYNGIMVTYFKLFSILHLICIFSCAETI